MPDLIIVETDADSPSPSSSDGSSDNGGSGDSQSGDETSGKDSNQNADGQGSGGGGEGKKDESQKKNGLEWVVFAIGVAITVGTIGYLIYEIATESNAPPNLEITLTEQRDRGAILDVDVEIKNTGDVVAEGAVVEVCGGPDTCAMLNIPYVPAGSTRKGTVGLNKPLSGPLETRAVSFRTP